MRRRRHTYLHGGDGVCVSCDHGPHAHPRRRAVWLDLAVAANVYRRARRRGLTHRVAWFWMRLTWADLPRFRAERGIDA